MSLKNAVNWFEIPVLEFERAISFYEFVLNTRLQRETMEGIDLAVFPADESAIAGALVDAGFLTPGKDGCLVYLNVEGMMDEVIQRVQHKGGEILSPKTNIGENGFIAHIGDSEGNKVALHSRSA